MNIKEMDEMIVTIRYKDATPTGDSSTQDSWEIDAALVHYWNSTGGSHGVNWSLWNNDTNPDEETPWSFAFDFPNGNGYYEFYTIGNKTGSPNESAPETADAICNYTASGGISISLSHETWDIGSTWVGDSNPSQTTGDYFTLTNDGGGSVDVTVNATDATNSTTHAKWDINDSVDHDKFKLEFQIGEGDWTVINETYGTFTNSLVSSETFDLRIYMASTSSTTDELTFTITFKAVAS